MAAKYGIPIHPRKVRRSSLSFIMPNDGKRAIVRCRDDDYLDPFPRLNLSGCRTLHLDGHQPDARCIMLRPPARQGSSPRSTAADCDQTRMSCLPSSTSRSYLSACASRWSSSRQEYSIISRVGAAKSAACCCAAASCSRFEWRRRCFPWRLRLFLPRRCNEELGGAFPLWARASAYKIQHLGNEAGLPTLADIAAVQREFNVGKRLEVRSSK